MWEFGHLSIQNVRIAAQNATKATAETLSFVAVISSTLWRFELEVLHGPELPLPLVTDQHLCSRSDNDNTQPLRGDRWFTA